MADTSTDDDKTILTRRGRREAERLRLEAERERAAQAEISGAPETELPAHRHAAGGVPDLPSHSVRQAPVGPLAADHAQEAVPPKRAESVRRGVAPGSGPYVPASVGEDSDLDEDDAATGSIPVLVPRRAAAEPPAPPARPAAPVPAPAAPAIEPAAVPSVEAAAPVAPAPAPIRFARPQTPPAAPPVAPAPARQIPESPAPTTLEPTTPAPTTSEPEVVVPAAAEPPAAPPSAPVSPSAAQETQGGFMTRAQLKRFRRAQGLEEQADDGPPETPNPAPAATAPEESVRLEPSEAPSPPVVPAVQAPANPAAIAAPAADAVAQGAIAEQPARTPERTPGTEATASADGAPARVPAPVERPEATSAPVADTAPPTAAPESARTPAAEAPVADEAAAKPVAPSAIDSWALGRSRRPSMPLSHAARAGDRPEAASAGNGLAPQPPSVVVQPAGTPAAPGAAGVPAPWMMPPATPAAGTPAPETPQQGPPASIPPASSSAPAIPSPASSEAAAGAAPSPAPSPAGEPASSPAGGAPTSISGQPLTRRDRSRRAPVVRPPATASVAVVTGAIPLQHAETTGSLAIRGSAADKQRVWPFPEELEYEDDSELSDPPTPPVRARTAVNTAEPMLVGSRRSKVPLIVLAVSAVAGVVLATIGIVLLFR